MMLHHTLPIPTLAAAAQPDPMGHVIPHYLFGSDWFTNHHLMSLVVLAVGAGALVLLARRMRVEPEKGTDGYVTHGRITQTFETFCVFIREEMVRPLLGDLTDRYIYYIWSTFFFILLGNLFGLVPISAVFGLLFGPEWAHVGGTMTGNLAFTGGLALIAFVAIHVIALKEQGLHYIKHGFPVPLKPLWLSPLLLIVGLLVWVLEMVIGPLIKAFALAIRLFANMVAGHLVLGSLIILVLTAPAVGKGAGVIGAALFSFLELFVAFLQAYIFAFLLVIFISLGAGSHDDHDEHHAGMDEDQQPGQATEQELTGTVEPAHA